MPLTGTGSVVVPIDTGVARFHLSQAGAHTPLPGTGFSKKEDLVGPSREVMVLDANGVVSFAHKVSNAPRLSQSDLYPVRHAFSPEHVTALRLLGLAVKRTERALRAMNDADEIAADIEVQKAQVLLPELFCCRSLGDGFGGVVNGLLSAFESLEGSPPNVLQLRTLNGVLSVLRDKPFLSSEEADEQLEQLEAVDLCLHPPELVKFLSSDENIGSSDENVR
jgi:hypothetical protein